MTPIFSFLWGLGVGVGVAMKNIFTAKITGPIHLKVNQQYSEFRPFF